MKCNNIPCPFPGDIYVSISPEAKCTVYESGDVDHRECLEEIEGNYCVQHTVELLKQYSEYLVTKLGRKGHIEK